MNLKWGIILVAKLQNSLASEALILTIPTLTGSRFFQDNAVTLH